MIIPMRDSRPWTNYMERYSLKKSSQFGRKYPQWRQPLAASRIQKQLRRTTPEESVWQLRSILILAPGMSRASITTVFLSFVLYSEIKNRNHHHHVSILIAMTFSVKRGKRNSILFSEFCAKYQQKLQVFVRLTKYHKIDKTPFKLRLTRYYVKIDKMPFKLWLTKQHLN